LKTLKKGAYNVLRLRYLLWASSLLFAVACSEDYQPKPEGYFRIGVPTTTYEPANTGCAYTFSKNTQATWVPKKNCWGDLKYPTIRATIQFTYKRIENENDLQLVLKEAQDLAYKHTVAAQGIGEKLYSNPEKNIHGILYNMQGNSASSSQFFVTDSTTHFLRGVLYFYSTPNADSLKPVNEFMQAEMVQLIESIEWVN
jgi:gliding motility-associated lipoprotein GldD